MRRGQRKMKIERILTDFARGIIVGLIAAIMVFGFVMCVLHIRKINMENLKYVERQIEIESLRKDYINRDVDDFLDMPDVRRAADGASDEFIRKRDEILQRFRNRLTD
jgi:hypothetical protein